MAVLHAVPVRQARALPDPPRVSHPGLMRNVEAPAKTAEGASAFHWRLPIIRTAEDFPARGTAHRWYKYSRTVHRPLRPGPVRHRLQA